MNKPTLSLCMIVKNEGLTIRRAMESMLAMADQYVIGVDDSSDDGTEEIVRQFAKDFPQKKYDIYTFKWEGDFSAARNTALDKCTKEWVFILDGHEYLAPGSADGLYYQLLNTPDYIWMVSAEVDAEPLHHLGTADGDYIPEARLRQNRLWRNKKQIRYSHASHNQILSEACPAENRLAVERIVIIHDRPKSNATERVTQRKDMNIPNFIEELKQDPTNPHALFYLGQSYLNATAASEDFDRILLRKAELAYRRYCELHGEANPDDAAEALLKVADIGKMTLQVMYEERREAIGAGKDIAELTAKIEKQDKATSRALFDALRYMPTRAETYLMLGELAVLRMHALIDSQPNCGRDLGDSEQARYFSRLYRHYTEATHWFQAATDMPTPYSRFFLRMPTYRFYPILRQAELNDNVFRYTDNSEYFARAKGYYEEVLRRLPNNRLVKKALDELKEFFHSSRVKHVREKYQKHRLGITVFDRIGSFTTPLMERWSKKYEVRRWPEVNHDRAVWGDIIFCAWADQTLIDVSQRKWDKPIYGRLCRYEAFGDMLRKVNWENVNGLIVASQSMAQFVIDRHAPGCPVHVINHGVDLPKCSFKQRKVGQNVAVVAHYNHRKGTDMLADIIIAEPEKIFHLTGNWQVPDMKRYFWWKLQETQEGAGTAADRVLFHGWQDSVDKWMDDIDANYLLSCSWSESFGYNIADAMAKGIKPVIRRFEASDELWPQELQFDSIEGAYRLLNEKQYDSAFYRKWVEDRYDADKEAEQYFRLFEEAAGGLVQTSVGFPLEINPTTSVVDLSIALNGAYERGTLDYMSKILKLGDVFVDVGAHIGLMTIHGSRLVGEEGRVIALEADPETFKRLRKNINLNSAKGVEAYNVAAGRIKGNEYIFELPEEAGAHALFRNDPNVVKTDKQVAIKPLDELLDRPPTLVKIDVEGWELEVLKGMKGILERDAPIVIVECTDCHAYKGGTKQDIYRLLVEGNGYRAYRQEKGKGDGGDLIEITAAHELPSHDNVIFVKGEQDAA